MRAPTQAPAVVGGVLDIVRSRRPARRENLGQLLHYERRVHSAEQLGVNPRLLLTVARIAMAKAAHEAGKRRRQRLAAFRKLGQDVSVLSRLQLTDAVLERLGQKPSTRGEEEVADVVFYTAATS